MQLALGFACVETEYIIASFIHALWLLKVLVFPDAMYNNAAL